MSAYQTPEPEPPDWSGDPAYRDANPESFVIAASITTGDGRAVWETRTEIKGEEWMTPELIARAIALLAERTADALAGRP